MTNWGALPAGTVIPFYFDTFAGATGASATITGLLTSDIEVVKGISATVRASDTGYALIATDGIDINGVTGLQGFSIDTGSDADAGFFAAGSLYTVYVSLITIDSQQVSFVAGTFRLVAAETVAGVPEVDLTHVAGATTNVAALATNVNAILADTDVIGATGGGLTSLATQASVNTIDDFLDTEIAAILAAVDTEVAAILALLDDARGEPGQGSPAVNPDAMTKIDYLYKAWRNRSTQTASEYALYADDGTTKDQKAPCSDDATTFIRSEITTGP